MIRLLFVLFCFLAFSQKEKRSFSEKIEENIEKGALAELIPFDQKNFSKEEVSTKLLGNDFLIVNESFDAAIEELLEIIKDTQRIDSHREEKINLLKELLS